MGKLEDKTAQQLIKPTDDAFSRYIRIRDCELFGTTWVGNCITCERQLTVYSYDEDKDKWRWNTGAQNGHFISRGAHQLRYDEYNCNLQCAHCNAWRDKESMLEAYRKAITEKYGKDILDELKARAEAPDAYKRKTKPELLEIINDSKTMMKYTLENS